MVTRTPPPRGYGSDPAAGPPAVRSALPGPSGASAGEAPVAGGVSRVSVLAPHTRVDVALPADVPVAELLPVLVDMAGEVPAAASAGWTLAPLGHAPVDPERTLAALGVLDGDQLVLRRRAAAVPAPLYDDVADAVAEAIPPSYRAWEPETAHRVALAAATAALGVAVVALLAAGRGPGTGGGVVTALVAGVAAALAIGGGALVARALERPAVGVVLGVGGVALAAVCGVAAVPAAEIVPGTASAAAGAALFATAGTPHLLLGSVLAAVAAVLTLALLGTGHRTGLALLVALAAAGATGALTGIVATVAQALAPPDGGPDAAAVAAGAGTLALVGLSGLPRAGIALARLPLPRVPSSAEELAEDTDAPDPADVERRTDRAHAAMTGLVAGAGVVVVPAVAALALSPVGGLRGVAGWTLAVLLTLLVALRSRTYANAIQATVLLVTAVLAGAATLLGAVLALPATGGLTAAGVALVLGGGVAVLGSVLPGRRSSPVARRAVDVAEAVGLALLVPLALAVMDLYTAVRLL